MLVAGHIAAARFGSAVVACENAKTAITRGDYAWTAALREACGKAYTGLGDRLVAIKHIDAARVRWRQALEVNPALKDDPALAARLKDGSLPPDAKPLPRATGPGPVERPTEHAPPPRTKRPSGKPGRVVMAKRTKPKPSGPPPDAGKRWDRGFGTGLSFGFDGVVALAIGWMTDERWSAEVSLGLIYPTIDARVRWFGLKGDLTPVVGLGFTLPMGDRDRFDLGLAGFDALYELGESIHVDVGLSWAIARELELTAAVAFVTPLDQGNLDTVLFFPQFAAQALVYF